MLGLVRGEIGAGDQPAVGLHPLLSLQRERAAIKPVGFVPCNFAVRPREVRLLQAVSAWPSVAVRVEKNAGAVRELAEFLHRLAKPAEVRLVEREAVLRDRRRLAKVLGEIDFAVFADREIVSCQRAGHADGQRTGPAQFGDGFTVAQEHVAAGLLRCSLPPVERHECAVRFSDQHETAAADPGVEAVHHTKCQRGCDNGIHRIAALFECLFRRLGRERMPRHHRAGFCHRLAKRQREQQQK